MSSTPVSVPPIRQVAVIGAGTMGRGIVMSLASAGIEVLWLDNNPEMIEQGLTVVAETYAHNVRQGRISEEQAATRRACVRAVADYAALAEADLAIEAVYENLGIKQEIFRQLDRTLKPEAILASNTSALDIDAIAAVTGRAERVLGLHFFSPAHIMKLLEIVRGARTAPAVLDAALELGRRMGKVAVVAGNCHGFIGNRMLATYVREARAMLLEGAYPYQVDAALQGFGFAMGPFRMYDVVGIDLEWRARQLAGEGQDLPEVQVDNRLCELGRFGQKTRMATTATPRAAARPSTIRRSTRWYSRSPSSWATGDARSVPRKSSSARCWRWSTRARRSSRRASPPAAGTSTWCTSTATASRRTRAGRWPGLTPRASPASATACWHCRSVSARTGSRPR